MSKGKRRLIKTIMCLIYIMVMGVLFLCAYRLYEENNKILSWNKIQKTEDYTYMDIIKMSPKFADSRESNIGYHFVTLERKEWSTYIIAINENEIETYKAMIEYSTGKTEKKPDEIRIYGYPSIIEDDIKEIALSKIVEFIPETSIQEDEYESYFTNCYLDTTKEQRKEFNIIIFVILLLSFIVFILLFLTIIDKDKIVDTISEKEEEEEKDEVSRNHRKRV